MLFTYDFTPCFEVTNYSMFKKSTHCKYFITEQKRTINKKSFILLSLYTFLLKNKMIKDIMDA